MSTCNTEPRGMNSNIGWPQTQPLAVTVSQACKLSGLGPTSIWAFLRDGRLEAVRVPGVRRTLVTFRSLAKLLTPPTEAPRRRGRPRKVERQAQHTADTPSPRRRGRPRKAAAELQTEITAAT
jgi:hypothetical protein